MDFINFVSDKRRILFIKNVIGDENYNRLESDLNQQFNKTLISLDDIAKEYLDIIFKLVNRLEPDLIESLPTYHNSREIVMVNSSNLSASLDEILSSQVVGFDTESRPIFEKSKSDDNIALMQISTPNKCFLFQIGKFQDLFFMEKILSNPNIKKVGIGLNNDRKKLYRRYGVSLENVVSIDEVFRLLGNRDAVGIKQMVARVLDKNISKKKSISVSRWDNIKLSKEQIIYAADDAFASLDVYEKLGEIFFKFRDLTPKNILKLYK